jgi:tetratricopeptide (TPR) repeat protein
MTMNDPYEETRIGLIRKLIMLPRVLLDRYLGWWFTRRWRQLLGGIPAILFAGLILFPAVFFWMSDRTKLADRYKTELNRAIVRDDFEASDVYLRKLLRLNATDNDVRYAMAYVAGHRGDQRRAEEILTKLVSTDDGYPRAHLWMARKLVRENPNSFSEQPDTLIHHLKAALQTTPPPAAAHGLLGEVYFQNQQYDLAIKHFKAAAKKLPKLHLRLARVYLKLNDEFSAKQELEQAARYFRLRVEADADDIEARTSWALVCDLQHDFPQAETILVDGLKRRPGDSTLKKLLAQLCVQESDRLVQRYNKNIGERLVLLERALQYAPNHPAALDRLAMFFSLEGEAGETARGRLKQVLAEGKASATVHLILATQALHSGDLKSAELHFDQGYRLNSNLPVLLNNFAWLLANQQPPQLDRALGLVNQALQIAPNQPHIRETRGQIYAKQGRWRDALADLEFALPHMSGNGELHHALSVVYRELGDEELASEHRRRWKEAKTSGK